MINQPSSFPRFIDPRFAGRDEVVGVGADLAPATLRWAYRHGIFPWPMDCAPLLWFCPPFRAVLNFDMLHIPSSLARARRRSAFTFTIDTAFDCVIDSCSAAPRHGQHGTWITPAMRDAYLALHRCGDAHSVEAWDEAGALIGGLYGVSVDGVFSGESMFHRAPNASKLALLYLVDHLSARGLSWIDIQVMTPHMAALGAIVIPRNQFLDRLETESSRGLILFDSEA